MHRFLSLKKLPVSNVNFSGSSSEFQYTRTCTLCNRISWKPSFAGREGSSRIHSTWANPERATYTVKTKKKYRIVVNPSKSKKKMRITVLDSCETGNQEVDFKPFITSSPSSPAFAGPKLADVGVTLVLPPNSPDRLAVKILHQKPGASSSAPDGFKLQEITTLSHAAAELMFGGLCRNRFLVEPYLPPPESVKEDLKPSAISLNSLLENLKASPKTKFKNVKDLGCQPKEISEPPAYLTRKEKLKLRVQDQLITLRVNSSKLKRILRRAAYIDVSISCGKVKHAMQYAVSGFKYFPDVLARNILLEPLFSHAVQMGDFNQVLHLLALANHNNVPLSMISYVVCFDLLGRLPASEEHIRIIRSLLDNMKEEGVEVKDLVAFCKNRHVLIKRILRAVCMVDPESAQIFHLESDYQVDVLLPLNNKSQSKAERYHSPASGILPEEAAEKLVAKQIDAHSSCIFRIKNIACQLQQTEIEKLIAEQKSVEVEWRKTIAIGLQNSLRALKKDKASYQLRCILECLPIEKYVELVIQEVHTRLDDSDKQSVGFIFAQRNLGKRVKEFYDMEVLEKYGILNSAKRAHTEYCKWYLNPQNFPKGPSNPREMWENIVDGMEYDDSVSSYLLRDWHPDLCSRIGKFLYSVLLKDVKINENIQRPEEKPHMVPALYVIFRKTTRGYQKQLKMHPAVHHIFPTKLQPFLTMNPYELPMMCPPRPWTTASGGVYPISSPALQRYPDTHIGEEALAENIESVPTQQLYPCLDSLNQLGSVPWKINTPVLDIITQVFNSGGAKELDIPSPPSDATPEPPVPPGVTLSERILISKKRAIVRQENAAMYSLWCDTLYKLCIAHEFRDCAFWLPHNMDFRGRVYPVCPHLQHMSNDMARSLLVFAKGEKLGPDGLDWLKLHTINLIGTMSKHSLDARLAYANEVLTKILDSAENPLTGERWWTHSEYPWQTLAACKEIASALASGDPESFISHFPVHQDGSCNGLQHYAALGRDTLGAKSVNLVDTDKPSDVYLCVSDSVEQQRARAAADGNSLAQKLEGFICRKVVKQTVMTTVYGVTQYGAQMQIRGQLKDLDFPPDLVPQAASYITKLVFQSLGEMFTSSRNTQDWLTQCANGIVKSRNMPVKWVTPLGLPVIQPYFKRMTVKKRLEQSQDQECISPTMQRLPTSQKHRNAFSPNFIHSLDSCHMILTGLFCEQADVPFVSVHDCYWVHAKNIPVMSKICREQFVSLHSKPILEELSEFLLKTYLLDESCEISEIAAVEERRLKRLFSAVPPKGDFDLSEVLKSKYFFS